MKVKALLAAFGILVFAGSAFACQFTSFSANADCNGWTASGTNIVCGSRDTLAYVVNLKQGSTIIATFEASFVVWATDPSWTFSFPWGMELCGDYVAEGHFYYISPGDVTDFRDFSIPFTCECGGEGGCHFTPGYWKNHPDAWPLTTLTLGCTSYSEAQCLTILNTPVKGDATIILAYHLIAAKLNVANGADPSIQSDIDAADALLCTYPIGSNPADPGRSEILAVKNDLADYNEFIVPGCEESCVPTGAALSSSAATETQSWGAIKSIYR